MSEVVGVAMLYVSDETLRLIRVVSGGKIKMEDAVRDAMIEFVENGGGEVIEYPRGEARNRVKVDDDLWRLVNMIRVELGYKRQDDLLFDVILSYLIRRGMDSHCVEQLLNL